VVMPVIVPMLVRVIMALMMVMPVAHGAPLITRGPGDTSA